MSINRTVNENHNATNTSDIPEIANKINGYIVKDYTWWEQRARNPSPLTTEEESVINTCGGLSYLRMVLRERGPERAMFRTVSNKNFELCPPNCICGHGK